MALNGWIILDKPLGVSSAQAVGKVKHLLRPLSQGKLKIGHAGTLDPLASGILPLALGEATKTVAFMMDADKAYHFTVCWGEERDTDDAEGVVTAKSEKRPLIEEICAILPRYHGQIEQLPPAFSAIKVNGKRAYALARSGEAVVLKAREVHVDRLTIQPGHEAAEQRCTSFVCVCGKGTYIRSLARDMGRDLGCFGYVSALRRVQVGNFSEKQSISLEQLAEMVHKDDLGFLQPVESALDDILALEITSHQAKQLAQGKTISLSLNREGSGNPIAIAKCNGKAVAICETMPDAIKPLRVFNL